LRYRGVLAYVGTFFHGWQVQDNAPRTVQAVLERALSGVLGGEVRAHAAGRTDAGVHADGQVVHFDGPALDADRLLSAVNPRLPWDAKLLSLEGAADTFHARRDARGKRYLYRFTRERIIPPREALFWAPIAPRADAARMARAARRFEGSRDFFPFSTSGTPTETTVRRVWHCEVREEGARLSVAITADAFLRGMARAIAGTLADVARGRIPEERIEEIFASRDRALARPKARARGLTLEMVFYDPPA
jgi:tRNA pseudouridine38-40 synthase